MMCRFRCQAEGIGVTPYEALPCDITLFKAVSMSETVMLPEAKPDIEQLISLTVDAEILSSRLVETVAGCSAEGQFLSGYKLLVELKLKQEVKYIADEPSQSVHAAHFDKVFSSIFVVVPSSIRVGAPPIPADIETLYRQGRLVVTPYIEDIYAQPRDSRTVFKNVVILLNVTVL